MDSVCARVSRWSPVSRTLHSSTGKAGCSIIVASQFGHGGDDDGSSVTWQRLDQAEALEANAEKCRDIRQMTGVRFGHEFLLDTRVRRTSGSLTIPYLCVLGHQVA